MCRKGLWTGALLALALVGCNSGERTGGDGAEAADAVVADPAFVASNSAWREERRARLLEPDGWASLIGLHWIELPAHYVGSGATSGIRLAKGPERMGLLQQQGGKVYFTPEQDAGLTVGEEPVTERFELLPETSDTPTVVGFDEGKGQLVLIERGGRKALRVRHAEAETLTGLGKLDYWPADPSWKVTARFVAHPAGTTVEVMDLIGMQQAQPSPGVVEFERDGTSFSLEALEGEDGGLFLIFADRTSGHESYAAGRYLYTAAPAADGTVEVDFNRAYNPPCVFSDFATCPLPPTDNRLDLPVTAGEKRYARS
ncbi:MAG TPA: DUF1684 domain-containing protein [Luteimonas sp.]|nr:DUF1684 domain-containing protein [Luteimonas sp.]